MNIQIEIPDAQLKRKIKNILDEQAKKITIELGAEIDTLFIQNKKIRETNQVLEMRLKAMENRVAYLEVNHG